MRNLLLHIDPILRGASDGAERDASRREILERGALILLSTMTYGGAMGSWGIVSSGIGSDALLSSLYSAVKVPLLLVATFLLSLPALFVFYSLAGLRADFSRVVRSLMEMQSGLAIILGSLAPFTLLWYASVPDYQIGVLFNALMFAIATVASPVLMRRHYPPLVLRNPRHRSLLRLWIILYVFIGIQMGWVLRPFIGNPGSEVSFFRGEDLDNAYVTVTELLWRAVGK
jgi:hypothetical protein